MNKQWHEQNPFPEEATDQQKAKWREIHKDNCSCGRMLLPYRRTTREKKAKKK